MKLDSWLTAALLLTSACADSARPAPAAGPGPALARPLPPAPSIPADGGSADAGSPASTAASGDAGAPSAPPALPAPAAIGFLERPAALERLFARLAQLEAKTATGDVPIVHYGDSHTASDLGTALTRAALQARFGDGGRGFVSIGKPWKSYWQEGTKTGMDDAFVPERRHFARGAHTGDGIYGLLGAGVGTKARGASAWLEVTVPAASFEIAYLMQPGGGSFEVRLDGASVGKVATAGPDRRSAFFAARAASEGPHKLEVVAAGDGDVRLFGATVDRGAHGVVYDALGINGAQIFTLLRLDPAHLAEQLAHRAPAAFVLAYGTNESLEAYSEQAYVSALEQLLARFTAALPGAACVLLGPPDRAVREGGAWKTAPKVVEIIGWQRKVAAARGCAFFDQLAVMGGAGSMARWAEEKPPRGAGDRVHLTRAGYAELGRALGADLLRAYDDWRGRRRAGGDVQRATVVSDTVPPAPSSSQ